MSAWDLQLEPNGQKVLCECHMNLSVRCLQRRDEDNFAAITIPKTGHEKNLETCVRLFKHFSKNNSSFLTNKLLRNSAFN